MNSNKSFAKTERFETRLTPQQKELLKIAATLENCKMAEFATRAIQEAVEQVLLKHQQLTLQKENSQKFVEALLNPPEPNQALKQAFKIYHSTLEE